jgi:epoxyqueuosine reductase
MSPHFHVAPKSGTLIAMRLDSLVPEETRWISERARVLGFSLCGVAPAERFPELSQYPEWLDRGYAGEMQYLHDARRLDPSAALLGVRSLILCALNYNSPLPYSTQRQQNADDSKMPCGWISRYAWGDDYHEVLWEKLNGLVAEMKSHFAQPFDARAYADTGPIHERAAAKHAGLGWLGKNTLLINQAAGSWLFLGVILTSLPLTPSLGPDEAPPPDRCGSCRACLDACPTQAFAEPYVLDASRCIAYLTIELRGPIPEDLRVPVGRHIFGCDICQDVCPWNRKSPRTESFEFQPREIPMSFPGTTTASELSLFEPDLLTLVNLTEDQFRQQFRSSSMKRAKWRGLIRNVCVALGNAQLDPDSLRSKEIQEALQRLTTAADDLISESALWALSRIQRTGQQDQHGRAVTPAPG